MDTNNKHEARDILNGKLVLTQPPGDVPPPTCERCGSSTLDVHEWHGSDGTLKMVFWCRMPTCGFRHWMEF